MTLHVRRISNCSTKICKALKKTSTLSWKHSVCYNSLSLSGQCLTYYAAANRDDLVAMIISIQRHLTHNSNQDEETQFLRDTVKYMETASGRIVPVKRWTITSFDVEFEEKLSSGGL